MGLHKADCESGNLGPEWSGSPNPDNPDNEWICDECGALIPADDTDTDVFQAIASHFHNEKKETSQ